MALKYRFNLKDIKLQDFKVYLVAMFKGILPKKKIKNTEDLEEFIQQKSAWVSQVTLYNYLKTRMGTKWVLHFDDETFLKSINTAKWNIYWGLPSFYNPNVNSGTNGNVKGTDWNIFCCFYSRDLCFNWLVI